jgi:hypothetical protein
MRRKKIVAGVIVVGVVATAGVAFAAIAGFVQVPDAVTGLAAGGGSASCQTTPITFEVPEPTFDTSVNQYTVSTIDYSGISSTCVTLGTADLVVTITDGSTTVYATATASNMALSTGTLTLSQGIEFEAAASASYNFLVRDN